jgi:uncharacterized protein (DUF58 family)
MVSALLGFMAISGVLGKWNLSGLRLTCIPPEEVYDGVPTLVTIRLENRRRWLPVFLMEVCLDDQAVLFPLVDPASTADKSLTTVLHGRGRQLLATATLRSRFPINFFVRRLTVPIDRDVTVFPRPLPCPVADQAAPEGRQGEVLQWQRGQDGDISRIGNYQGDVPLKRIHWKLSARHDLLKVKEFSAAAQTPVIVDLDALPARDLEQRLRFGSDLVSRLMKSGRPVGLQIGAIRLPPGTTRQHRLRLLTALALYGQD